MSDLIPAADGVVREPAAASIADNPQDQASAIDAPLATVPSPCIDVCKINGDTGLCIGCLRTRDEIRGWKSMNDDRRTLLIEELSRRKANPETGKAGTL